MNSWGGGSLKFADEKAITGTEEEQKQENQNVSDTSESDVGRSTANFLIFVRSTAKFPIFDLKDDNISEKMLHRMQMNHLSEKLKKNGARSDFSENTIQLFGWHEDLKHKTSVDPKLIQSYKCIPNKRRKHTTKNFSPFSMILPNVSEN